MASNEAAKFEEAIEVIPLTSHTYSANLRLEWCIGTVPNGGYVTSCFYQVARTHMLTTHPTMHKGDPNPIALHLSFLRRTEAGPATFRVQDTKLGARTSTLHITLSQLNPDGAVRDEVAGYITMSNLESEMGPSVTTTYKLVPPPAAGSSGGSGGGNPASVVDLITLAREGRDGAWARYEVPPSSMRGATRHVEFYTPTTKEYAGRGFVEQWVRFKPYGKVSTWSNQALGFLVDMFPMVLEALDEKPWLGEQARQEQKLGTLKFWYPTVVLNIEFKKKLPANGAEWLYSRVQSKVLKNGRNDIDIVILDADGDVVALSNHVALIMGAERNLSARKSNGNSNAPGSKI